MSKAMDMNHKLRVEGDPSFKASIGWLHKFKCRHSIRQLEISGEKLTANRPVIVDYRGLLLKEIDNRNLVRKQVFSCEETSLTGRNDIVYN